MGIYCIFAAPHTQSKGPYTELVPMVVGSEHQFLQVKGLHTANLTHAANIQQID